MTLFGAVLSEQSEQHFFKLFIHFERIRARTLGDVEQIKIIMSGAVRPSVVQTALYELFVHPGRTRLDQIRKNFIFAIFWPTTLYTYNIQLILLFHTMTTFRIFSLNNQSQFNRKYIILQYYTVFFKIQIRPHYIKN